MATIRAFTTIEQSRKLADILPLESADMYYFHQIDNDYFPPDVESICPIPLFKDGKEDLNYDIPCWSLAALLDVLPEKYTELIKEGGMYRIIIKDSYITSLFENPVDACVAMVEKLKELNLL